MPAIPSSSGTSLPVDDGTNLVSGSGGGFVGIDATNVSSGQSRSIVMPDRTMDMRDLLALPVLRSTSPHAATDYFDGTTLNAKWSWNNQGTATVTVGNNKIRIVSAEPVNETTHNQHALWQSVALHTITNWRACARITWFAEESPSATSRYQYAGIVRGDSTTGRTESLIGVHNNSLNASYPNIAIEVIRLNSPTSHNSDTSTRAMTLATRTIWLKWEKIGTSLGSYWSVDGISWILNGSFTHNTFLANADRIGLVCDSINSGTWKTVLETNAFVFEEF